MRYQRTPNIDAPVAALFFSRTITISFILSLIVAVSTFSAPGAELG